MWKSTMARGEGNKKDFNVVQIHQDKKFFISELFKVIQDAIPLILNCRTIYLFRTISTNTIITSDVQSIYIPSRIQDWYRENKNWAKDRRYSLRLWILWTKNTEIQTKLTWKYRVLHGTSIKSGRNIKTQCLGSTQNLLKRKDLSSIKHDRTQSSFTTQSQLIVSRRLSWWKLEKSYTRKYMRHLDLTRRFPLKTIGWKNWVQKLLEVAKTPNKPNQKPKTQLWAWRDLWRVSNQPVRFLRKSKKSVLFGCESTNVSTERPVKSCVPVSVERLDKDKDADENVDADQIRTERPVKSGQSIGLFTQREEIDIGFRVSGLPHAVVKQAENFRVRELVKKIESHPRREALQADLQQNNVYNPFSDDSKAIIREMGNVELLKLCETIPKVQCSECLLYWNQGVMYCTCGHLLVESESSQNFSQWRLDTLSIPHYAIKKGRPHGARHGKTEAQKEHFAAHNARKRCIKKNFDEFTIVSNEIQYFVIRNSKLAGPRRSASRWTSWHRKTTPTAHPLRSMRDIRKTGISHWTNQAGMHRWNSDQNSPSSSSSTSGWQWNENWWSS